MKTTTRVRLGLALIAGCLTATALYGVLRVIQKLLFPEADPALVIWSEHAGFFWRAWTVSYVGGMIAFVVWLLASRSDANAERAARALERFLLPFAVLAITLQGLLVP